MAASISKLCACGRCVPVEQASGLVVCASTGLETTEAEADFAIVNGDRVNTRTGVVVESGLGTHDRDAEVLGEEGVKAHDFDHFAGGDLNLPAASSRVKEPQRTVTFKRQHHTQPVLTARGAAGPDAAGELAAARAVWRVPAAVLVGLFKSAPGVPALAAQQQQQLTAHLQRLLDAVDQDVHASSELLCALTFLLAQTLQGPVRCGHKTNINQAFAIQGKQVVPPAVIDKGFNRSVVKVAQDVIAEHSLRIFDVQPTPDDLRPSSSTLASLHHP